MVFANEPKPTTDDLAAINFSAEPAIDRADEGKTHKSRVVGFGLKARDELTGEYYETDTLA